MSERRWAENTIDSSGRSDGSKRYRPTHYNQQLQNTQQRSYWEGRGRLPSTRDSHSLHQSYQNLQRTSNNVDDGYGIPANHHIQYTQTSRNLGARQSPSFRNYSVRNENSYQNPHTSYNTFSSINIPNANYQNQFYQNMNADVHRNRNRNVSRERAGNVSKVSSKCQCGSENTPQQEGVDNDGMLYQYSTVIYVAINLSEKSAEERYVLFCNPKCIKYIDDLILKVIRNGKHHLYFFQMKHSNKNLCIDKKSNVNGEFDKYKTEFVRIIEETAENRNKCLILKDVDTENMHFLFYSNYSLSEEGSTIKIGEIECNIEKDSDIEQHENYGAILPKKLLKECYKLVPPRKVVLDKGISKFLEKTRLFLYQPHPNDIGDNIIKLYNNELSDNMVKELVRDVHGYFKINKTSIMTRETFESELLRIRLSDNIDKISHDKLTEMNIEQVRKWNEVTSSYDIVLVEDVNRIKPILFGCILQKIRDFLMDDVTQQCLSIKDVTNKFMERAKKDGNIPWIDKTDSFDMILIELWRHYNIPLILSKDTDIGILNKYRHLKKNFILRCDVGKQNAVMKNLKEVFTSVADIKDKNKRSEFLKIIQLSLQGRKPVSLESIIGTNEACMKKLGSAEILCLIKKKSDIYLDEKSFETIKNMVIIKEISEFENEREEYLEVEYSASKNLVINCHSSNVEYMKKKIKDNAEYGKYLVYHLKQCGEKLKFESGKKTNVKDFLVNEDGNHVFTSDASEENITVIGTYLGNHEFPYSARKLHIPILKSSIFHSKPRVYFIIGKLESLDDKIRKKVEDKIKMTGRLEEFLQNCKLVESDLVYHFENLSGLRDIVNNGDSLKTLPVVVINVSTGKLVLVYYKNCDDLNSYISYAIVSENVFSGSNSEQYFKSNPITVITGDVGMGKTALLHSLSQVYDEKCIVIFCNLTDYRKQFQEEKKPIREIEIDLNFIESRFNTLFRAIYNYQVESGKILLLLDSFDEMWPTVKQKLLDFIEVVARKNISMIIASRTIFANKIIDDIPMYPIKLANLSPSELQNCYGTTLDIKSIPKELLKNPLYFTFIINLHKNGLDVSNIDLITLYQLVIAKMIDRYEYTTRDEEQQVVLEMHQQMALVLIFEENFLKQQSINIDYKSLKRRLETQKIKLGIIKELKQDYPVFVHHTFAEFLTAEWLSENLFKEDFTNAPSIYREMVENCDKNVQNLFDSFICKDLPLHKAIIKGDLASVKNLLSEDNNTEKVDKCGRNASHLAACYCLKKKNYEILKLVVRHMIVNRKCTLHCRDTFLNWTWLDYLKIKNPKYFLKALEYESIAALKNYGFEWPLNSPITYFPALCFLHEMGTYFDIFAVEEIIGCGCLDIACELIEFYCQFDSNFVIFLRLCEHIYDITDIKRINARIHWSEYENYEFTLLHVACLYGHSQTVKKLIESGADVNVTDNDGATPMHYAIIGDSSKVVSTLLKSNNFDTQFVTQKDKYTYLHFAAKWSNSQIFELLFHHTVNKNVVVNQKDASGDSSFITAVRYGKLDIVKFLSSNCADVTLTIYNDNALHLACQRDHYNIIWYLATKCPYLITIEDRYGTFPFDYASDKAKAILTQIEITQTSADSAEVELQSLNEAQIDDEEISTDMVDEILLLSAPMNNNEKLIEFPLNEDLSQYDINKLFLSGVKTQNMTFLNYLVEKGLNVEDIKEPILHAAIEIGNIEIIKSLLDRNIKINIVDKFNRSAMHIAARKGDGEIVVLLLQNNIDLNIVNKFNETALHIAFKYGNLEIVKLLVNAGINLDVVSWSNESALHYAVKMNDIHMVNLLLQKGANINIVNEKDETALFPAIKRKNMEIFKLLVKTGIRINGNEYESVMCIAYRYNMWKIMKMLVEEQLTKFDTYDKKQALWVAINKRDINIIKRILESLTDNESIEYDMFYSIYKVSANNEIKTLFTEYLRSTLNQSSHDAAFRAGICWENFELLEFLIDLKIINLNFVNEGGSYLHYALGGHRTHGGLFYHGEHIKSLVYLIPKCKDVISALNNMNVTVLEIAVMFGHSKTIINLLERATDEQSDGDDTTNAIETESSNDNDSEGSNDNDNEYSTDNDSENSSNDSEIYSNIEIDSSSSSYNYYHLYQLMSKRTNIHRPYIIL